MWNVLRWEETCAKLNVRLRAPLTTSAAFFSAVSSLRAWCVIDDACKNDDGGALRKHRDGEGNEASPNGPGSYEVMSLPHHTQQCSTYICTPAEFTPVDDIPSVVLRLLKSKKINYLRKSREIKTTTKIRHKCL